MFGVNRRRRLVRRESYASFFLASGDSSTSGWTITIMEDRER